MERFRVLITDLTNYGNLHCVAGWDIDRKKMVRPEPHAGGFWEQTYCGAGKPFAPGNIVTFEAAPPNPKTALPHLNEDMVVAAKTIKLEKTLSRISFSTDLAKISALNREKAFAPPVEFANGKAFVRTGTNHTSLVGLAIPSGEVSFTTEKFGDKPPKPRCLIAVPNKAPLNLSIAATDLRDIFKKQGDSGLTQLFAGKHDLHIRLGLARGWGAYPDRCYMQVNGIYRL